MRKVLGALALAIGMAATAVAAQDAQRPDAVAMKSGWWVRVDTQKTEASSVTLQIGTKRGDRRAWRSWRSGQEAEFDVPGDFQSVKELYIQASSNPAGKMARFCVFYGKLGMKRFDVDGDKEDQIKQTDRDEACH